MTPAPRVLLAGGAAQSLLGLLLALVAAAPSPLVAPPAHALVLASGLALLALAAALALSPAFTGREAPGAAWAWPVLGALLAGDALLLAAERSWGVGAALLLAVLAPSAGALRAPALALREAPGPFRVGDRVAAAALGAGAAGVAIAGLLLVAPPRGLPVAGLAVLLAGGALPLLAGALAFLLPRLAKAPLAGGTLLAAALAVLVLAAGGLALAFALPGAGGFRAAAAGVLLAETLALAAFLRARLPVAPEGPAARARPFLRAAAVLAPLAGLALLLAVLGDAPNDLLPLAAYAHLALGALLAGAAVAAGAPFLGVSPRGGLVWHKLGAALLLAGLFLLAPSFQHPRAAFPGALAMAAGSLLAARPFLARSRAGPARRGRKR